MNRFRVFIWAFILIPLNSYLVIMGEVFYYPLHTTAVSLFYNALVTLILLLALNAFLLRSFPRLSLSREEILLIYIMICLSTSLCGHDMLQILMTLLGHAHWFANEQNRWAEKFFQYLPGWLIVTQKDVLEGYYCGGFSLLQSVKAFLKPMISWGVFTLILYWTLYYFTALLSDGWIHQERLTFPIAQVPLELTRERDSIFKNKLFLVGCGIAGISDIWHGVHYLLPYFPDLSLKWDLSVYISTLSPPWNAIGWTPLCIYPFAIGLSYFIPTDLAFSCFFFYWLWKLQMVIRNAVGIPPMPGPYQSAQSSGAWIGFGLITIWFGRKYILQQVRKREITNLVNFSIGFCSLIAFGITMGMSLQVASLYFALYLVICISIARMRAELGPPTHDLYAAGPDWIISSFAGSKVLGPQNLVVFSLLYWITRDYRSHPVGHMIEGQKITSQFKEKTTFPLIIPVLFAGMLGFLSAFLTLLYMFEKWGLASKLGNYYGVHMAWEAFNRLDRWLEQPTGPDLASIKHFFYGLAFVSFLSILKKPFPFQPFHPVGYAVAGSWTMSYLWFSVFLSWLVKMFILKYGGLRSYRTCIPFFLGFIVGEYIVCVFWVLFGTLTKAEIYRFFI
ncbi:hypothetical protein H5T87_04000 [bacterium]|nr:hypothetical protein [bacterium]